MSTADGVDYRYQILPLVHRVIDHDSAPQDMLRPRESCPLGPNELLQRYSHVH